MMLVLTHMRKVTLNIHAQLSSGCRGLHKGLDGGSGIHYSF